MVFDKAELEGVKCPNGNPLHVTLAQGRPSATIRCPRCGGTVTIDGRQGDQELRKVDRAMDDLKRTISKFGR